MVAKSSSKRTTPIANESQLSNNNRPPVPQRSNLPSKVVHSPSGAGSERPLPMRGGRGVHDALLEEADACIAREEQRRGIPEMLAHADTHAHNAQGNLAIETINRAQARSNADAPRNRKVRFDPPAAPHNDSSDSSVPPKWLPRNNSESSQAYYERLERQVLSTLSGDRSRLNQYEIHGGKNLVDGPHQTIRRAAALSPWSDFDAFNVKGSPQVLLAFSDFTMTVPNNGAKLQENFLRLCNNPVMLTVKDFRNLKNKILKVLEEGSFRPYVRARGPLMKSTSPNLLPKSDVTVPTPEMVHILTICDVKEVYIKCFGMKMSVDLGLARLKRLRELDSKCVINVDVAVQIPPPCMHWPHSNRHAGLSSNSKSSNGSAVLVRIDDTSPIREKIGRGSSVQHYSGAYALAQFLRLGCRAVPNFGNLLFTILETEDNDFHVNGGKVYDTLHHVMKSIFRGNFNKSWTGRTARTRFEHLEAFSSQMTRAKPSCRIELSFNIQRLPPSFMECPNPYDLDYIWDALWFVWNQLNYLLLPVSEIKKTIDWALDYVRSKHHGPPKKISCFRLRNDTRLTQPMRNFSAIIYGICGVTSEEYNVLFFRNFRREAVDRRAKNTEYALSNNRSVDYVIFAILAFKFGNASVDRRERLEDILEHVGNFGPCAKLEKDPIQVGSFVPACPSRLIKYRLRGCPRHEALTILPGNESLFVKSQEDYLRSVFDKTDFPPCFHSLKLGEFDGVGDSDEQNYMPHFDDDEGEENLMLQLQRCVRINEQKNGKFVANFNNGGNATSAKARETVYQNLHDKITAGNDERYTNWRNHLVLIPEAQQAQRIQADGLNVQYPNDPFSMEEEQQEDGNLSGNNEEGNEDTEDEASKSSSLNGDERVDPMDAHESNADAIIARLCNQAVTSASSPSSKRRKTRSYGKHRKALPRSEEAIDSEDDDSSSEDDASSSEDDDLDLNNQALRRKVSKNRKKNRKVIHSHSDSSTERDDNNNDVTFESNVDSPSDSVNNKKYGEGALDGEREEETSNNEGGEATDNDDQPSAESVHDDASNSYHSERESGPGSLDDGEVASDEDDRYPFQYDPFHHSNIEPHNSIFSPRQSYFNDPFVKQKVDYGVIAASRTLPKNKVIREKMRLDGNCLPASFMCAARYQGQILPERNMSIEDLRENVVKYQRYRARRDEGLQEEITRVATEINHPSQFRMYGGIRYPTNWAEYCDFMAITGRWMTSVELSSLSDMYDVTIACYIDNSTDNCYVLVDLFPGRSETSQVIWVLQTINHFDALLPKLKEDMLLYQLKSAVFQSQENIDALKRQRTSYGLALELQDMTESQIRSNYGDDAPRALELKQRLSNNTLPIITKSRIVVAACYHEDAQKRLEDHVNSRLNSSKERSGRVSMSEDPNQVVQNPVVQNTQSSGANEPTEPTERERDEAAKDNTANAKNSSPGSTSNKDNDNSPASSKDSSSSDSEGEEDDDPKNEVIIKAESNAALDLSDDEELGAFVYRTSHTAKLLREKKAKLEEVVSPTPPSLANHTTAESNDAANKDSSSSESDSSSSESDSSSSDSEGEGGEDPKDNKVTAKTEVDETIIPKNLNPKIKYEQKYNIGTKIEKEFYDKVQKIERPYSGRVIDFDLITALYQIEYDSEEYDSEADETYHDREDMVEDEVKLHLASDQNKIQSQQCDDSESSSTSEEEFTGDDIIAKNNNGPNRVESNESMELDSQSEGGNDLNDVIMENVNDDQQEEDIEMEDADGNEIMNDANNSEGDESTIIPSNSTAFLASLSQPNSAFRRNGPRMQSEPSPVHPLLATRSLAGAFSDVQNSDDRTMESDTGPSHHRKSSSRSF